MPASLRHFGVNCADVTRARRFYAAAFGWAYEPWGPPGFWLVKGAGVGGSIEGNHEVEPGVPAPGIDLSFAVDDLKAVLTAIPAAGGALVREPFRIDTVGEGVTFRDSEGNIAKAMQYFAAEPPDPGADGARFRHFAVCADDLRRARAFYETVFGWTFVPWGPPDFSQIPNAGTGLMGALHLRREVEPGLAMPGFEVTFGVHDLMAAIAAIEVGGGRLLAPPHHLDTVGELVYFQDSEGNIAGAMQYEAGVWA
jgi:predicted enzyme related to lactoylglutathione lyase